MCCPHDHDECHDAPGKPADAGQHGRSLAECDTSRKEACEGQEVGAHREGREIPGPTLAGKANRVDAGRREHSTTGTEQQRHRNTLN